MFMLICFGYVPNYPIAHVQYIRSFLNLLENNSSLLPQMQPFVAGRFIFTNGRTEY